MQPLSDERVKRTEFLGLDPAKDYTIKVCTVANGRSIARRFELVKSTL